MSHSSTVCRRQHYYAIDDQCARLRFRARLTGAGLVKGQMQSCGAERVGMDVSDQPPLSLNDAIRLALENNNEIEVATLTMKLE